MRLYNALKSNFNLTKSELKDFQKNNCITVNQKEVPLSTVIGKNDIIYVNGIAIKQIQYRYFLYYKPRGILSTVSKKEESYIHQIKINEKVTPAGRLDKESEGLMLLSNDGAFLNELTGDKSIIDKEYIVYVKNEITDEFLIGMEKSYPMDGKMTTPAVIKKIDEHSFSIILFEGFYHQIRRLVKINKNYVISLKRIRIGKYMLNDMQPNDLIEFHK